MQLTNSILIAVIALILLVYTYFGVDESHYFIINTAWNSTLIEAKTACYLIGGLGICLAAFYAIFSNVLFSKSMIILHVVLYILLVVTMVLWDNNNFSFQEIVDSNDYKSVREVKSVYNNILEKNHAYRLCFWFLLCTQTIGLLNLFLGFFKSNKD